MGIAGMNTSENWIWKGGQSLLLHTSQEDLLTLEGGSRVSVDEKGSPFPLNVLPNSVMSLLQLHRAFRKAKPCP